MGDCEFGFGEEDFLGDCEFGFDEEEFFSAEADGEPTSEERRRGDSGPFQEVFAALGTVSPGRVLGAPISVASCRKKGLHRKTECTPGWIERYSVHLEHPAFHESAICSPVYTGPTACTRPMLQLAPSPRLAQREALLVERVRSASGQKV
eukprot:5990896-Amphidinium_carterae.1